MNTELNPNQRSNRNRDKSFMDSAEARTLASAASEAFAFYSQKKCETTGACTTLSPTSLCESESSLTSTSQKSRKAFSTQLQMRSCSESSSTVGYQDLHSLNRPNRKLLGGKGMFLTLMQNAGLAVPPFAVLKPVLCKFLRLFLLI